MKVLYFMNHADKGGAMLALYDLLVELKKSSDIEPIIFTGKKNNFNNMLDKINVENYWAPYKNFISSYKKPKNLFRIFLWLRYIISKPIALMKIEKIIDFKNIDIIHTNLDRIDIGAYYAKKYNIPHIWHIREHLDDDFKTISIFKNYIKYMEKYNSTYVAISKSVKNRWVTRGLPENKIKLIYDGIRAEGLTKREINYKTIKMIFIGGYSKNKGQEEFIEALGKLPQKLKSKIEVDFYGNGNLKYINYLEKKIRSYNLKNVKLNPYDNDIYSKISNYTIGVNCSRAEGFGRITVEYMLAGICPLVSNTGANIELISDKETGIIYKYSNIEDLVNKIIYIYENIDKIYNISLKAKEDAKEKFTIKLHTENILKLYNELIKKKRNNYEH